MAKEFAKAFYNSKEWQRCRYAFIKSVFGLCRKCKQPGRIVHHKITLTPDNINDPSITLNWALLEYLCLDCHNAEHGGAVTRNDVVFDSRGQLVMAPPKLF